PRDKPVAQRADLRPSTDRQPSATDQTAIAYSPSLIFAAARLARSTQSRCATSVLRPTHLHRNTIHRGEHGNSYSTPNVIRLGANDYSCDAPYRNRTILNPANLRCPALLRFCYGGKSLSTTAPR